MEYIICYDIGTSGVKCGLYDDRLNCIVLTQHDYELYRPAESVVEAEPEAYITGMVHCTRKALEFSGIQPADISALCVTTQGETLIPVDNHGEPLCRAIVWMDGRATTEAEWIRTRYPDPIFKAKTGLPGVDGYTPLAKLLHIKRTMPEVYERTCKFLLLEDYVVFRLTGRQVTEKSLLCSTGYFDLAADNLWTDSLDLIGVDQERIPDVVETGDRIGTLTVSAAQMFGLTDATVVYAGAMDQIAGAVGCGNCEIGGVHETTGTAMIVAATMGLEDCLRRDQQLTIYRHAEKGKYLLLSVSRTATAVLKWFAEQFCPDLSQEDVYDELSRMAAAGAPGANGVMMLPYFEGMTGANSLRGAFWNVGLHHTRADFARAIFEGIAYMLKDNIRLIGQDIRKDHLLSIGGASKSQAWCSIKANVTGLDILTIGQTEAALFGCACFAAVGSGRFGSLTEALGTQKPGSRYSPSSTQTAVYNTGYEEYCKVLQTFTTLYTNRNKQET